MMIRTFKAASFQEACEQVQSMMGPNAFILKREKKRVPGVIGWLLKRYEWEIVAAKMARPNGRPSDIHSAIDPANTGLKRRKSEQSGAFRIPQRRNTLSGSRPGMPRPLGGPAREHTGPIPERTIVSSSSDESPLAKAFAADKTGTDPASLMETSPVSSPVMPLQSVSTLEKKAAMNSEAVSSQPSNPELKEIKSQMESMQSMFQQFMAAQQEKDRRLKDLEQKLTISSSPAGELSEDGTFATEAVSHQKIDDMVKAAEQASGKGVSSSPSMVTTSYSGTPEAVRNIINHLRHAEFEAPLIASVRGHLFEVMDERALASESAVKNCVADFIAKSITTTGGLKLKRGEKQKCVALVGPTGVGKTTTLAKLAAGLKFNFGLDVGFITIDTYRVAACDQLEKYGEIIDVPVHIAFDPKQLKEGLEAFAEKDVILIDTVGRNGKNSTEIEEIGKFLDCGVDIETHLVLSACSKYSEMKKDLVNFAPLGYGQVIFSKTDESSTLGTILSLVSEAGKSVSYVTTGQNVPDDIIVADPARLAQDAIGTGVSKALESVAVVQPSLAAIIDNTVQSDKSTPVGETVSANTQNFEDESRPQ